MKCPNCGYEMQEGHLICENCAFEINVVPDFDPSLDIQIDHSLVDDVLEENQQLKQEALDNSEYDSTELDIDISAIRHRAITLAAVVILSLLIVGVAVGIILHTGSYEYQLNNAKDIIASGKYESAISYLENMYVSNPDKSEIFLLEADCYVRMDNTDMAIDTIMRLISSNSFTDEEKYIAYDRLIALYAEKEDFSYIDQLLEECPYEEVKLSYQNYMAMEPMYSIEDGEYEESIRLKLSANTSGIIYYTLDGSVPNESSDKYGAPILLESGEYKVSAIFVNQYGIVSNMVTHEYVITSEVPNEPIVNVESGDYTSPVLITIEVPEDTTVYYTTDKTIPNEDSVPYRDPIPMPIGYSNFNFIAYSSTGVASEVLVRSFNLTFPDGLRTSDAIDLLKNRLVERGVLTNLNGESERAPGNYTYQVISAIPISGQGDYYTIREFYHDISGDVTPTDTTYIVEIHQGSTAILGGDANNGFLAISF